MYVTPVCSRSSSKEHVIPVMSVRSSSILAHNSSHDLMTGVIVESERDQKALTSYRVAASTIFGMVVLKDHGKLFGLKNRKFLSAILVFGGHFGFTHP